MDLATILLLALPLATPDTDDWPHLRGPGSDGRAQASGIFAGGVGLRVLWRVPLGPSYSGVVVAGGRVVTMLSDAENDYVVALDSGDGSEQWRHVLGPVHLGHDGSEDGPISSPLIAKDTVFAIGPRGQLVALDVSNGETRWSLDLVGKLGATPPDYGFTTTPLLVDGTLVVQAGGSEEHAIVGLDPGNGALRWSLAGGPAAYASPVAMDLAGTRQVVVLDGKRIIGVAPDTGALLWEHALGERESASSGVATPLDGERFVATVGRGLGAFRVARGELGFTVEPVYSSRSLSGSYAAPVVHGKHVYGFNSDFLSCIDAENGKRVWKSRPPGGRGLILVEDRLVVLGAEGVVAVVRATPEGYQEEARVQALEHTGFTWPSFAGGRVYVRNSSELACVELAGGAAVVTASTEAVPITEEALTGAFGRFLSSVRAAETSQQKNAAIDAFIDEQQGFPIVEGERVHFVYRGPAQDVAIGGSMAPGRPEPLQRVDGTDLYHASYTIEPGTRWEYRFQVDLGEWSPDPLNPRTSPATFGDGPVSEIVTEGYVSEAHFEERENAARGRLEELPFESAILGNERTLQVYLPAGYDAGEESYPLLIVHEGDDWLERGGLRNTLDNVIGGSVRPLVAVFVPPIPRWWYEGGGTGTDKYLDALATELVPALSERYRLSSEAAQRALLGTRSFGMTAVFGALRHPEVFGRAAVQSIALNDVSRHAIFAALADGERRDIAFYVDWNRYELRDADSGTDYGADSERLWKALTAAGYLAKGGEALDAHGWGSWRSRSDDLLVALFPLN